NPQIVALSATVGNPEQVAGWLGANLIKSDWRPVKLTQGVFYDGAIFFDDGRVVELGEHVNADSVCSLVSEVTANGGQALVFVSTRKQASAVAARLTGCIKLSDREKSSLAALSRSIATAEDSGPLSSELAGMVKSGVAFHHAGLPLSARSAIEEAFKLRLLKALVSTTTLAAGLNLPARRVVVYDHTRYEYGYGRQKIPVIEYHQMAGRAGRPGLDPYGEAVLIAKNRDEIRELMRDYISAPPETLEPHLTDEQAVLPHVLSTLASNYAETREQLLSFFSETFSGAIVSDLVISRAVERALAYLSQHGFISDYVSRLQATLLGKLTSDLYLHPSTALMVLEAKAYRQKGSEETPLLHMVGLPFETPKLRLSQAERDEYTVELDDAEPGLPVSLEAYEQIVGEFGVDAYEYYIQAWKTAKVLSFWVEEKPEAAIEERFGVQPGDLYQLYSSAAWVARSMATMYSTVCRNRTLALSFSKLALRLEMGIKQELVPLVALRGIGRVRARALYSMGLKSVAEVAEAPVEKITRLRGVSTAMAERIIEEARKLAP
ncbi:MAG: helix-hairpin-helix domain-containing protein, partial [Thermoprotei archaeon]